MSIDLRRSGKFPQSFEESGYLWKVLKREGLWLLSEGRPVDGMGKKCYAVSSICQDSGSNALFSRPRLTVTDMEQGSPFLDLEQMTAVFERKAAQERGREAEIARQAKEELKKNEQVHAWQEKVRAIREEQSNLIDQLKKDCLTDDVKFISSKKTKEVCSRLSEIEEFLHHAKPREVGAI